MQSLSFPESFIVRFEEDLTLIFDPKSGAAFKTDGVGTIICRAILQGKTPEQMAEEITAIYDVSAESALNDSLEFLCALRERGLLEEEEESFRK